MPEWTSHATNLLLRSWHSLIEAMGTTSLALAFSVAIAVLVFLVTILVKSRGRGLKAAFRESVGLAGILGVTVIISGWILALVGFVIITVYIDHQAFVSVKDALASDKARLTKEVGDLRGKLEEEMRMREHVEADRDRWMELAAARKTTVAVPCPPHSLTFFTGESINMDPTSGQTSWGLTKDFYRPPGSSSPFSARIAVTGESILWSDDGTPPNRVAKTNAQLWMCGERVVRFRARPSGTKPVTLQVSYVR